MNICTYAPSKNVLSPTHQQASRASYIWSRRRRSSAHRFYTSWPVARIGKSNKWEHKIHIHRRFTPDTDTHTYKHRRTHTHTNAHILILIYASVDTYIHVCLWSMVNPFEVECAPILYVMAYHYNRKHNKWEHKGMHTYRDRQTHTDTHTEKHRRTHTHAHARTHTRTHAYTHAHIWILIYEYVSIYIYIEMYIHLSLVKG